MYRLAFLSALIVLVSLILTQLWISSCDLTYEHEDMTCSQIYFLYTVPRILTSMVYIAETLSNFGIADFQTNLRFLFNQIDFNDTIKLPGIESVLVRDMVIEGIVTYGYTPLALINTSKQPVIFYFHGGGGILMSPKLSDYTLRKLADDMKVKILAPDYRKSPEVCFPQPQEDCITVVTHVVERNVEFSIDPANVFIMGDSFGGHAAVYTAFKWHDLGFNRLYGPLRGLIPVYPRLQWVNLQLPSYLPASNNGRMSSPQLIATYLSLGLIGSMELHPYILNHSITKLSQFYQERLNAFPHLVLELDWEPPIELIRKYSSYADTLLSPYATLLFQSNFSVLPPTLIIAAEYDTLYSEGRLFKSRLEESEVSVEYFEAEKMFHGFFHGSKVLSPRVEAYRRAAVFVRCNVL